MVCRAVVFAAREGRKAGKLVILDPAPAANLPDELYHCVDVIKPNETELGLLTGIPVDTAEEIERAACRLLERGVGSVVDTTAAGDSFTAAMAMFLTEAYSLEQAISFAIEVAAVVVTRPGAQSSIPNEDEIREIHGLFI